MFGSKLAAYALWVEVEGCISWRQEKRNEKVYNMHSIMTNLNLGQDVANKRERK